MFTVKSAMTKRSSYKSLDIIFFFSLSFIALCNLCRLRCSDHDPGFSLHAIRHFPYAFYVYSPLPIPFQTWLRPYFRLVRFVCVYMSFTLSLYEVARSSSACNCK